MKNQLKNFKPPKYFTALPDIAKNKRATQLTYLTLTLLALIFFGLFAINPTISTIVRLQKELADSKFVDEQLQRKITNLNLLQTRYQTLSEDLPTIESALPKNPSAPLLTAQVQSLAQGSGVSLTNLQVFPVELTKKSADAEKASIFSFSVLAEGEYQNLSDFLSKISQMQRVISFNQISLIRKSDESSSMQLNIRGSAFFKP